MYGGKIIFHPEAGTPGVNVAAAGSANTKGSFSGITLGNTEYDYDALIINLQPNGNASGLQNLTDIAIGAIGQEHVIIPNIMTANNDTSRNQVYCFTAPIFIPKGSRISARTQATVASEVIVTAVHGLSYGLAKPFLVCSRCSAAGINTGDSSGLQVDPGATPNQRGAYSSFGSTTFDVRYIVVLLSWQANLAGTAQNGILDLAIGAAGQETPILQDYNYFTIAGTGFDMIVPTAFGFYCNIPSGTRIAARAESSISDATDRLIDVALLVFG